LRLRDENGICELYFISSVFLSKHDTFIPMFLNILFVLKIHVAKIIQIDLEIYLQI